MEPIFVNDSPKPENADLRTAERIKVEVSVAYSFEDTPQPDQKSAPYHWGTLLDISERGLCFKATDYFFVQRVVRLYLKLSHQTSGIKMLGKILWTATDSDGSTRVGVQFIGTLPADWRKLLALRSQ